MARVAVLTEIVKAKAKDCEEFAVELLQSGERPLHEAVPGDGFWGVDQGKGENWMGKILMLIRKDLQDDPGMVHVTSAQLGKEAQVRKGVAKEVAIRSEGGGRQGSRKLQRRSVGRGEIMCMRRGRERERGLGMHPNQEGFSLGTAN